MPRSLALRLLRAKMSIFSCAKVWDYWIDFHQLKIYGRANNCAVLYVWNLSLKSFEGYSQCTEAKHRVEKKIKIWIKWLKVSLSGSFLTWNAHFLLSRLQETYLKGWLLTGIEPSSGDLLSIIISRFFRIFLCFGYLIFYLIDFTSKFAVWPLKEAFLLI